MKKISILFFACFASFFAGAQTVTFEYDSAGNQIQRELCITCTSFRGPKETGAVKPEDLVKFFPDDVISYYPNPVKEQLYLEWELTADKKITNINVYSLSGQMLAVYNKLENAQNTTLSFLQMPEGIYNVLLNYSDGTTKAIKIVKK